jgi:asparagine synthase (glutamine-hydrolysing)
MKGRMPESIRDSRVKVGFNSPMPEWLAGPLRPWVEALMDEVRDDPLVDVEKLRRLYRQRAGAGAFSWANYASTWLALNYLWFRRSLDGPAGLRP